MNKKTWKTPELIVIVRSKPEESVLVTCKGGTIVPPTGGPGAGANDPCAVPGQSGNYCNLPGQS
jgi:hypothetical protein